MFIYYIWGTEINSRSEEVLTVHCTTENRFEALKWFREERELDKNAKLTVEVKIGLRKEFKGYSVFVYDDVWKCPLWVADFDNHSEAEKLADAKRDDGFGACVDVSWEGVYYKKQHLYPEDLEELPF